MNTSRSSAGHEARHQHIMGWRWARHTPPWIGAGALFALALIFRGASWGLDSLPARMAGVAFVGGSAFALLRVATEYARPRFPFITVHLRWTILGLATLSSVTLLIGAPIWWRWIGLSGAAVLCLSWNLRNTDVLKSHDHESKDNHKPTQWDNIGLTNLTPSVTERSASRTVLKVVGSAGRGAVDMIRASEPFTNLIGARPGGVQVVRSLEAANKATVIINHIDHLLSLIHI